MSTETSTDTLTTDTLDGEIVVRDSEGGVWWPSAAASDEIRASAEPDETALRICCEQPMRGEWRQ